MNKQDLKSFENKLLEEKRQLEADMNEIGQKDSASPKGWEAKSGNIEVDNADENEVADKFEQYEGNTGVLDKLETQLAEVNAALERVGNGTYGKCEVCSEPIERERLEANPSARISIKHNHK